jgi:predicted membrane-bound dolichyl-phosphate-mannose-protein mannosyltransferase
MVLNSIAEIVGNRIVVSAIDSNLWSLNGLAILDVFSSDLDDLSVILTIRRMELSDNCEFLGGVDSEATSWSIEVVISVSVRGKIATVLVTNSLESFTSGIITAIISFASVVRIFVARMSSESL